MGTSEGQPYFIIFMFSIIGTCLIFYFEFLNGGFPTTSKGIAALYIIVLLLSGISFIVINLIVRFLNQRSGKQ